MLFYNAKIRKIYYICHMKRRIIAPSLLAADFACLGEELAWLNHSAAEWLHIDVMDGVFVTNISFGFPILSVVRERTTKFVDTHLMIIEPEKYVERFAKAGSDMVTFHLEATQKPMECIEILRREGVKVGISIKPQTAVESLREYIPQVDMVLIMSVEPGYGGQGFIDGSTERVAQLRELANELQKEELLIQVDGGVGAQNAGELFTAGADILVAGSSVFGAEDPQKAIEDMLNAI